MIDPESLRASVGSMSDADLLKAFNAAEVESDELDILTAEIERRELDT